jgi:hypothetical protein
MAAQSPDAQDTRYRLDTDLQLVSLTLSEQDPDILERAERDARVEVSP